LAAGEQSLATNNGSGGGLAHPERFVPDQAAGTLMDSEHRGRYCWAAQILTGRSVLDAGCGSGYGFAIMREGGAGELTGVDVDPEAVAAARVQAEPHGATVVEGDLLALDLPDDSFDAAVCFETIEHLRSPEQGLAELRRVVRPGGMLLVSSPNPDVYPSGNPHHQHELRPDDLRQMVQEHFNSVGVYVQHAWLASVIEPARNGSRSDHGFGVRHTTEPPHPDGTTFTIVIGCDEEPPRASALVSLGEPFEVKWWQEQVAKAGRRGEAQAQRALQEAEAREAKLEKRLQETSAALIDANQELAQAPLLKHRLAEMYDQNAALKAHLEKVLDSRSWQVTGFLRKLSHMLKLQR
jgi:SAM-dependent methyltransferase